MKTAEQAIHDALWKRLSEMLDGKVYESRPMREIEYPFADFEDFTTEYIGTKGGAVSKVKVNMNIWDAQDRRNHVSSFCGILMAYAQSLSEAYGYGVSLRINDSMITISEDRTVTPSIWRGRMYLVFDIL